MFSKYADFYSPLGERGEEEIENPDLSVVFDTDIAAS